APARAARARRSERRRRVAERRARLGESARRGLGCTGSALSRAGRRRRRSAPVKPPPDWAEQEPGMKGALGELSRLKRRALARPIRTLVVALAATLAVVGMRARKVRTFSSRVVFRVTEGDLDAA